MVMAATCCGSAPASDFHEATVAEIESTLEDILASEVYRHLRQKEIEAEEGKRESESSWLQSFYDWLWDFFDGSSSSSGSSSGSVSGFAVLPQILRVLAFVAAFSVLLLLIYVVAKYIARHSGSLSRPILEVATQGGLAALDVIVPPGEQSPDHYASRAAEFASAGNYRDATRELLLAGMSTLERRQWIRYRRGLTNRDYVRAARRHGDLLRSFSTIVRRFDELYFGRRAATERLYEECLLEYERGIAAAPDEPTADPSTGAPPASSTGHSSSS